MRRPAPTQPALAALVGAMLLAGLWSGLARMGWRLPDPGPLSPVAHGVLMVGGFFGALISIERAVALRRWWAYAAGPLAILGAAVTVWPLAGDLGRGISALAAALLVTASARLLGLEPTGSIAAMTAGAACWLAAEVMGLAGRPFPERATLLAGFLVLTIMGERLELSRLAPPSPWRSPAFFAAVAIFVTGLLLAEAVPGTAARLLGVGLLALAAWGWRFDLARRTLRLESTTRFIAVCLLAGYAWLAVSGISWTLWGPMAGGFHYDAALHALFVGFVLSMVFGHVFLLGPALLRLTVPFRPRFYAHLGLLHASLLVRVIADVAGSPAWRRWGGLGNALAVVLFLASTAPVVLAARHEGAPRPASVHG